MAYPAAAIANELLDLAAMNAKTLTPMHVQKLVYFAHGWNLAIEGELLINERVEAWDYGPVVRSLYTDLRRFGSGPITERITGFSLNGSRISSTTPSIDEGQDAEKNDFTKALVCKIWETYGHYKAFQLSEMTHVLNSPWSQARNNGNEFISDESIRNYFANVRDTKSELQKA